MGSRTGGRVSKSLAHHFPRFEKILQQHCDPLEPQVAHEGNVLRGPASCFAFFKGEHFLSRCFFINVFVTIRVRVSIRVVCFLPPNQELQ